MAKETLHKIKSSKIYCYITKQSTTVNTFCKKLVIFGLFSKLLVVINSHTVSITLSESMGLSQRGKPLTKGRQCIKKLDGVGPVDNKPSTD